MTRTAWIRLLFVLCLPAIAGPAAAQAGAAPPVPATVSPGEIDRVAVIDSRCPSFSWSGVPGASSYELAVFAVPDDPQVDPGTLLPALETTLPGRAHGWTPSLDRCPERGQTYIWLIRAVFDGEPGGWSETATFRVRATPTPREIEEALSVLRSHVEDAARAASTSVAGQRPSAVGRGQAPPMAERGDATEVTDTTGSAAQLAGAPSLVVDGDIQANSFLGSFDAADATSGALHNDRYSAYGDLLSEGYLDNNYALDLLTRQQLDGRFLSSSGSHTHSASDISSGTLSVARYDAYADLSAANRLDGGQANDLVIRSVGDQRYASLSAVPEVQAGVTNNSAVCNNSESVPFARDFSERPSVTITPEGLSGPNTYCVIHEIEVNGFSFCCYGNVPDSVNWIAFLD